MLNKHFHSPAEKERDQYPGVPGKILQTDKRSRRNPMTSFVHILANCIMVYVGQGWIRPWGSTMHPEIIYWHPTFWVIFTLSM